MGALLQSLTHNSVERESKEQEYGGVAVIGGVNSVLSMEYEVHLRPTFDRLS